MPSSRILARCCDSADWESPTASASWVAYLRLTPLHELAQDHQPALVGECAQHVCDLSSALAAKAARSRGALGMQLTPLHLRYC